MSFNRGLALFYLLLLPPVTRATGNDVNGAIPASPAFPVDEKADDESGFTPRYYAGAFPPYQLGGRQAPPAFTCGDPTKNHTCGELGDVGERSCCANDRYCYFDRNWTIKCCSVGNKCDEDGCEETHFKINLTKTSTFDVTTAIISGSVSGPVVVTSTSEQILVGGGCKPRKCSAGQFQCDQSYGGNCCSFGAACLTGGSCGIPVTESPTGFVPTANGCPSRNQFACPTSLGGSCCFNGQTCVVSNGVQGCAGTPTAPPGTEIVYNNDGGLSQGAKAGIGVGVAVGGAMIIGLVIWFCLRQRRRARSSAAYPSQQQYQSVDQRAGAAAAAQGGAPAAATAGAAAAGAAGMSEAMSEASIGGPHRSGLAYEYFGPDAVAGPYTYDDGEYYDNDDNVHAVPHHDHREPRAGRFARVVSARGVPIHPESPGDITAPVELGGGGGGGGNDDSGLKAMQMQAQQASLARTPTSAVAPPGHDEQQAVYELWGSPGKTMERSPLDEEVVDHHQQQQQQHTGAHSAMSSNTENENSQENPDQPHSTESGSTAAESAQDGSGQEGHGGSTAATAAESARMRNKTEPGQQ